MKNKKQALTIPNLLTLLRMWLILPTVLLYLWGHSVWAALVLALSGLTDLADGYIARRFRMVSDVGKVLDPVADKLTQIAVLFCLSVRFPVMLVLLGILLCGGVATGFLSLAAIRSTGQVRGADWHGKLTSAVLYAAVTLHFLWEDIPPAVSNVTVALCGGMIFLSCMLYIFRHLKTMEHTEL